MGSQPALSEAEREVLRALWDHGPGAIREIRSMLTDRGRNWAYTTVATLLQRLQVKHYVASDSSILPHVYHATVSREELLDRRLKDAAAELCDGQAAPLLLALVQANRFSPEELARFRHLLDAAGSELKSRKPKS
jgi:BlaI family transcriptional regulator, penicillinase repressor